MSAGSTLPMVCRIATSLEKQKGLLQKVWYDDVSPKIVFHLAIETFKEGHEHIIADYLQN